MSDNLNCPFCGSKSDALSDVKLTFCANPKCPIYGHVCDTEKWNRRTPDTDAALRARCSSCPNIIEAGTRLEQALVAVEKRDKVIAAIPSGVSSGCPPEENWPCHPSDCAECWNNWIKERLK
jgi:hypothetical protein